MRIGVHPLIWVELPEQAQADLLEWFNCSKPDSEDKMRLADLFSAGKFHAWDCPTCGDRVYHGEPEDWDHFQGVREADHMSYPGMPEVFALELIEKQCNDCRCHLGCTLLNDEDRPNRDDTGL